jgi:hypothetical protein
VSQAAGTKKVALFGATVLKRQRRKDVRERARRCHSGNQNGESRDVEIFGRE